MLNCVVNCQCGCIEVDHVSEDAWAYLAAHCGGCAGTVTDASGSYPWLFSLRRRRCVPSHLAPGMVTLPAARLMQRLGEAGGRAAELFESVEALFDDVALHVQLGARVGGRQRCEPLVRWVI
jgi:hypothetical protein